MFHHITLGAGRSVFINLSPAGIPSCVVDDFCLRIDRAPPSPLQMGDVLLPKTDIIVWVSHPLLSILSLPVKGEEAVNV